MERSKNMGQHQPMFSSSFPEGHHENTVNYASETSIEGSITGIIVDESRRKYACGTRVVIRTAWTRNNHGRQFYGCSNYSTSDHSECGHFSWCESKLSNRSTDALRKLLARIKEDERKYGELALTCKRLMIFIIFLSLVFLCILIFV
ncbi:uncharacterized protein LOC133806608 [Humulus lupulus]|uniref:uncharacterized protein LOC133806608 n=1 Tax=Humulus lupulus TaxID=3486 RepID=UPI002B409F96|nr:uncharacterized protein LOC133806608 [Humulus lupulus]